MNCKIENQAGSDGDTNFGVTSLAAPNAVSSSLASYSFVARPTACGYRYERIIQLPDISTHRDIGRAGQGTTSAVIARIVTGCRQNAGPE